jgi:hypothetical protein
MNTVLVFSQAPLLQRGVINNTASQQRDNIFYTKSKVTPMHTMNTHREGSKVFLFMKSRSYREHPQNTQLLQ